MPISEEMLQRWRSDLTDPKFEPQTSRSKDERDTARPTVIEKHIETLHDQNFINGEGLKRKMRFCKLWQFAQSRTISSFAEKII